MSKVIEMLRERKEFLDEKVRLLDESIEHARKRVVSCTNERDEAITAIRDIESAISKLSDELPTQPEVSE